VRITLLGTGTSTGIPAIGCKCPVCASADPRDARFRASVLIETAGKRIVVDTAPEFRLQALRIGLDALDAVLFTHNHADHLHGIDDLRMISFSTGRAVDCYGLPHTMRYIRGTFRYIWEAPDMGGGLPHIELHEVDGPFEAAGVPVVPLPVEHAGKPACGFRIGNAAYIPDAKSVPMETRKLLDGLDVLILDALRLHAHPTHLCLSESVALAADIGAERTYFTHIAHSMGLHADVEKDLPEGISLAYDGLVIEIENQ
jgi:phosphoribosyl 1,2-cyclic phosphate phosphodiesterase